MMTDLQGMGCLNINFVSPTHVVAQTVAALPDAVENGLRIPLVYNTGGYDSAETLRMLDGIIDIYMPDMKYSEDGAGMKYSGVEDYWPVNTKAVKEMFRQVGDLAMNETGVATRGLLIRHLVLPEGRAGSRRILEFIARELSVNTYLNIMDQYRPCHNASRFEELSRRPTEGEMRQVFQWAFEEGLTRLDDRRRASL
jgi:putative pyruvate formate lyase activating enzyme